MVQTVPPSFLRGIGKLAWATACRCCSLLWSRSFRRSGPDSYFTANNAQMIASTNAVLAILALAAVPPLVVGQFDLSIGFQLALAQSLCAGMIIYHGVRAAACGGDRARDWPCHRLRSTASWSRALGSTPSSPRSPPASSSKALPSSTQMVLHFRRDAVAVSRISAAAGCSASRSRFCTCSSSPRL